ncbi:Type II secretory pathway, component PulF [Noviherbaspirillum humi]|uniref:Type II secretory pathway, component PulF n=1 Tax=Noviherbaspirillum humi TaxID=1688639 RepID=A0A239KWF9_9BURK|nr:type II secretion system F family protein [Noviherbaspirillum humi]SNT21933.1 Type II secretory pathway, component PulF [Noviherbaspirillum humi]
MEKMLKAIEMFLGRLGFRSSLADFYDELADQLRMNVSIGQFIASKQAAAKRRNQSQSVVFAVMKKRLGIGGGLSDALRGFIPSANLIMIRSGEQVGRLIEGVSSAGLANRSMTKMRNMMLAVLTPALTLFLGLFGVYLMFGFMIVPQFLFIVKLEKMGGSFQIAYFLAEILTKWWYVVVPAFIGFITLVSMSVPRWTGRLRRWMDYIPPYSIYRSYLSAVLLINLSALLRSNVTFRDALTLMSKDATPYMRSHLMRMQKNLAKGGTLAAAMDTGLIPAPLIDYLVSFEASGKLEEVMKRIGFENLERALTAMEIKLRAQAAVIKAVTGVFLAWIFLDTFSFGRVVGAAARSGGL